MGSAVRRLAGRGAPLFVAGIAVVLCGAAVTGGAIAFETSGYSGPGHPAAARAVPGDVPAAHVPTGGAVGAAGAVTAVQVAPLRRIVPPDLLLVSANGITPAELARIGRLGHVRDLIAVAGGAVRLQARPVNVLGVDPGTFRSWTPPPTAANERIWASIARDELVLSAGARARLGLRAGASYPLAGATQRLVRLGASAALGIPGVDALVSRTTANSLGLVPDVAAMVNAPGADIARLMAQVRAVLGAQSEIINLDGGAGMQPARASGRAGRPTTYLELYRQSAALYCPGLSWTILAAIGQIESGHGSNNGPSSAGALGPMQFLPSTWQMWGIPGFGDTTANILDPYDAVPSAARYLCASGAAAGGAFLYRAIYAYNHADWYVRDVLALAGEYATQFG